MLSFTFLNALCYNESTYVESMEGRCEWTLN